MSKMNDSDPNTEKSEVIQPILTRKDTQVCKLNREELLNPAFTGKQYNVGEYCPYCLVDEKVHVYIRNHKSEKDQPSQHFNNGLILYFICYYVLVFTSSLVLLPKDSDWFVYFESLNSVKIVDSFLRLSYLVGRDNEPSKSLGDTLYIRGCYTSLVPLIINLTDVVVTGTPGIGKTFLRNFFAHYLLHKYETDVAIIFTLGNRDNCTFLIRQNKELSAYSCSNVESGVKTLQKNMHIYNLCDISKGESKSCLFKAGLNNYHHYMFTSPNLKAYGERVKQDTILVYLPLWSKEEVDHASRKASQVVIDSINNLFTEFGGIARVLFGNLPTVHSYRDRVANAIGMFDFKTANTIDTTANNEDIRHCIIHLEVSDENWQSQIDRLEMYNKPSLLKPIDLIKYNVEIHQSLPNNVNDQSVVENLTKELSVVDLNLSLSPSCFKLIWGSQKILDKISEKLMTQIIK